jgi:hypothetical protein
MPYNGDIGDRPDELDGCWSTWTEQQSDNVVRNTMDKGNVKTRRRFTGITRAFKDWFNRDQRQGTIPTYVKTPYGTYELFLWTGPPNINWIDSNHFEASVTMYQGSNWT